jgi:hypothetical protein
MRNAATLPLILVVICLILTSPRARAADQPASPDEIKKLIAQLGDDDYKTRDAAAQRLRAIGKPAVPALQEALNNADPEVVARAQTLIKRLEVRPLPGPDPNTVNGIVNATRARWHIVNGNRVLDVIEAGREIHITDGPDGIAMTVTGLVDGQRVTEEYTAKDADELKQSNPEAHDLYQRWTGGGGAAAAGFIIRGPANFNGPVQIGGLPIPPMPIVPDEIDLLRSRLDKQMRENKLKDAQRAQVDKAFEKLADARNTGGMDKYSEQADELRKTLEELKLDPGDLLPPPASARLGVSISSVEGLLLVQRVGEKSRAQRIGLQPGDQIQKVDGKPIKTVAELRKAVTENTKSLKLFVTREGADLTLEEKRAEKKPE